MKHKILIVFGTRPEAIKMAPVIKAFKSSDNFDARVCVFRQHKETLDEMLNMFGVKPDYDFPIRLSDKDIFSKGVPLYKKGINLAKSGFGLARFLVLLLRMKPDTLFVQGDTSTAMLAAVFASNLRIPVAHVEAGLRTYDNSQPFPEEMNRRIISAVAELHFAPTETAKKNLLREGIKEERVFLSGNTEIDATLSVLREQPADLSAWQDSLKRKYGFEFNPQKKLLLVTAHRRENFGDGLLGICGALKKLAESREDVQIVYPVHHNPNVNELVHAELANLENIHLLPPVDYAHFVFLMSRAHCILTDSGGIQEAASVLGKPVLVMREVTERPEAVKAGSAKLVGTNEELIVKETIKLLDNKRHHAKMSKPHYSFGDGAAAEIIVRETESYLNQRALKRRA